MAAVEPLNDNDGERGDEPDRVFVRVFSTSPGTPWTQSKQADLEARLGAPSRLADLVYRVRRLEPWRPAQGARFAAIYARVQDAHAGFNATTTVDGRSISVSFSSPAVQAQRVKALAAVALGCALGAAILVTLVGMVEARRAETSELLTTLEGRVEVAQIHAREADRVERQTEILDEFNLRGQRLSQALSVVAWASAAKTANAHIQALHWDHGFTAVEAGGDKPPLDSADHPMQRSRAPLRPGVWLWGTPSVDPWGGGASIVPAREKSSP